MGSDPAAGGRVGVMKSNIYIHIGVHKTGTTSIQATFYENRRKLKRHDINYFGIGENHSGTLYPLFCDAPHNYHVNRRAGIDTETKAARKNAATARALRRALEANRCSRFVISGEDLSELSPAGIARLKQTLAPHAARMRVIVYVREPYDYITSAFQQRLRRGSTYDELVANPPKPRYRMRLSRFIEAFGREQVDIRLFEPARFVDGDLIADFLAAIEAPPAVTKELTVRRRNEALSLEAARLIKEVNKRYPLDQSKRLNPARAVDLPRLLAAIPGQKFACPPEVYAAVALAVDRELHWLRRLLGEDLFKQPPPPTLSAPQWNEETIAALAIVINELAQRSAGKRGRWQEARAFIAGIARQVAPRLFGRNGDGAS